MKKLLIYLKDYKKESVLGPLFKLLEASFELIVPLVIAAIIDNGIANNDIGYIIKMCLVLVALGLIGLICSATAQFFAAKASVGFTKQLRHALFMHMQGFSHSKIDSIGTSTMITRMTSDINQVQNGVNLTLRLLLRSPFVVFGAMIMAFTIDVPMALIFAVTIPLLSIVVFGIMLFCIPLYKKVQERLDKVLGITHENLEGVRVIRAFGKEKQETEQFFQYNEALTSMQKYVGRISALMNPITYIIINFAIIALIWKGAIRVDIGILTQGQVVALYNYMSQILVELIKLANLIINITKSVACGNRIQSIFEIESGDVVKSENTKNTTDNMVEFKNVSLRYENAGDESLSNMNFAAKAGEVIGVIGGTGSGKTSLVNMIPRFYDATKGTVFVDGSDVTSVPTDELRGKIGIVPQKAVLFKGTIRENMKWGNKDVTDEEIMSALEIAQGKDIVAAKEDGLNSMIEQGGKNLSGGQRQRLTIARALVRKPKILILDDSSSALDFATDAKLRKALNDMENKPTIFIVSQRTASIQLADKIIVLDDGNIVGLGKHEELLENCEVYREIYDLQFKKEAVNA